MNETVRSLPVPFPAVAADAATTRLMGARITSDVIQEPAATDPRRTAEPVPDKAAAAAPAALPLVTAAPSVPGNGLRAMPLAAFSWGGPVRGRLGGRGATAAPRVRGDHVVIHVTDGTLGIELPRIRHMICRERLAFIPAGTAFSLHPPPEVQGWALLVPPGLTRDLPVPLPMTFHSGVPDAADAALLEPSLRALGQAGPRNPSEDSAAACQLGWLAVALSRAANRPETQNAPGRGIAEARPLTEKFIALATANLAQGQTMADMAGELGCSLAHLDRACVQSRGRGALELLYGIRLDRAAALLRDTALPAGQIAQDLGYSSLGHFMRSFAAGTGRTPESFRESTRDMGSFGE